VIHYPSAVPDSTEAEIEAFEQVCTRLAGFDEDLSYEYIDGWLTALAAGPVQPALDDWLPRLLGDTFERTFADPPDAEQARAVLAGRLKVLCAQLDAEALLDAPDDQRLSPLIGHWRQEDIDRAVADGQISADDALHLQDGTLWAEGFADAVQEHDELWIEPASDDDAHSFGVLIEQVLALMIPGGDERLTEHLAEYWPGQAPSREDLIAEALWAVQDLRIYWLDRGPRPEQRRVEAAPGRNDPCPCGSGKKFKKCHGAAA
jgi:uncharacterized protein